MLTRIMQHEWRNLSADQTLWLITALFALIIGYGVYNGAAWVRTQKALARELSGQNEESWARLKAQLPKHSGLNGKVSDASGSVDPHRVGSTPQQVMLPPAPLAALSVGQGDLYPNHTAVSITSFKRTLFQNYEFQNPIHLLAGRFDLAFVIVYLYPLLILALSYNLITAEREQGTLAMLLAQPVTLRTVVFGKTVLRALVIMVLAIGFSLAGMLLSGAELKADGAWLRGWLWIVVVIAYGGFWFSLALAVNAWGRSSATNAMVLAGLWLTLVIVVPALVNILVTAIHPVPSRVEFITAVRDVSLDARRDGSKILAKYYEDHPELRPAASEADVMDFTMLLYTVQREVNLQLEPVAARFDEQLARQQGLVNRVRFLSPAIVTQEALNDIAGTGVARYQYFRAWAEQYASQWRDYFVPKIFQRVQLTAKDYDDIPRFHFIEESNGAVADRVLVGLTGLLAPTLIISLVALSALRRYPIMG